jgi:hypothetical protein
MVHLKTIEMSRLKVLFCLGNNLALDYDMVAYRYHLLDSSE